LSLTGQATKCSEKLDPPWTGQRSIYLSASHCCKQFFVGGSDLLSTAAAKVMLGNGNEEATKNLRNSSPNNDRTIHQLHVIFK
jgi:hypothetical protein